MNKTSNEQVHLSGVLLQSLIGKQLLKETLQTQCIHWAMSSARQNGAVHDTDSKNTKLYLYSAPRP